MPSRAGRHTRSGAPVAGPPRLAGRWNPIEHLRDRHAKHVTELHQPADRDAVDPVLVFLNLLKRDAGTIANRCLADPASSRSARRRLPTSRSMSVGDFAVQARAGAFIAFERD